jgi:chromosome segregation ATPase
MTELPDLERRIAEALERIRGGVEGLSAAAGAGASDDEMDALRADLEEAQAARAEAEAALEEERTRTAALEQRLAEADAALSEAEASAPAGPSEAEVDALRAKAQRLEDGIEAAEAELRTLRATLQEVQAANAELRRTAITGVTEPDLINRSLAADLEAVQAARKADLRDMDTILRTLEPLLEGGRDA